MMAYAAKSGQKTVTTAGTPEQLGTGEVFGHVLIGPLGANTGYAEVGDVNTAASGFQLKAGQAPARIYVTRLDDVYVDVTVNGEGVSWLIEDWTRL